MEAPSGTVVDAERHKETLANARAAENAGDEATAERGFREALAATRGSGLMVAWVALANLTGLFMRQGRECECLILIRRLIDGAAGMETFRTAWARQALCMALANLEDWDRLAVELPRFEALVPDCPEPHATVFARSATALRATVALKTGTLDDARAASEALSASIDDSAARNTRRFVHLIAAEVALRARRWPEALAEARLARPYANSPMEAVAGVVVEVECLSELEGVSAARDAARLVLEEIDACATPESVPAHLVRSGPKFAEVVAARCGDDALARRAYDLAGAAVVGRAVELERAFADLPELADPNPEDEASLAAFRRRFREEKGRFLRGVARLLADRAADGAFLRPDDDALVRVCAWCLRLESRDGTWTPVGHFFAGGPRSRVTHGICFGCAAAVADDIAA